jgi:hypothetical protein
VRYVFTRTAVRGVPLEALKIGQQVRFIESNSRNRPPAPGGLRCCARMSPRDPGPARRVRRGYWRRFGDKTDRTCGPTSGRNGGDRAG